MSLGRILLFGVLALLPSMAQATDWRAWTDHLSPYVVGSYGLLPVHARYLEYDSGGGSGNGIPQDMRMTMVDKKGMIGLAGLRVGGDVPLYVRGQYATGVAATVGVVQRMPFSSGFDGLAGFSIQHTEGIWFRRGLGRQESTVNVTGRLAWHFMGGRNLPYHHPVVSLEVGLKQNTLRGGITLPLAGHHYHHAFTDGRVERGLSQRTFSLFFTAAY